VSRALVAASLIAATATAHAQSLPPDALPVPLVRQIADYDCGAASLAAVLYYFRVFDGREPQLFRALHISTKDGVEPARIAEVARQHGLRAELRRDATVDELRAALSRREPVILDLQAWPERTRDWRSDWDDGHYVVLVGADAQFLYVMDPSTPGRYTFLPIAEFVDRWHDVERAAGRWKHVQHQAIAIAGSAPSPQPLVPLR
jgi:predicted double-glycine peptidase